MTLETFYYISQIVAAIAVIASLVFVGIQVRGNARALRAATSQEVSQSFVEIWLLLATNPDLTDLVLRSGNDFEQLTRLEKARVRFQMMAYMRIYENAYLQHGLGILRNDDWDAVVGDMRQAMNRPSAPAMWALIADRNGVKFRAFVDSLLNDLQSRP